MANLCKIQINNEQWYVPCSQRQSLFVENGKLYNNDVSSITLYKNINVSINSTNYPFIQCYFGSPCRRVDNSYVNYYQVSATSIKNINYPLHYYLDTYSLYILIIGVFILLWKFFKS